MIRIRDFQLAETVCQKENLAKSVEMLEKEKAAERQQLESVIMELQEQLLV